MNKNKNSVIPLNNSVASVATCNLQNYQKQNQSCPVLGTTRACYFIPLSDIESYSHNPARSSGTDPSAVVQLLDSLISDPQGQLEPICVEWNPATGKFDIVFGCHREWATSDAYAKGYQIANHPQAGVPGIWAWSFLGSAAERTALQLRENGNKKPSSPAKKGEVVNLLRQYISQGGLDINYSTPFATLNDDSKYQRAKEFMKKTAPFWGQRRFKGVWNQYTLNGSSNAGLSFTTYSKSKLAEYFCSNNPYGIKSEDLNSDVKKLSGSVVKIGNTTYGIYFVNASSEVGGALPTSASRKRHSKKVDHMIVVAAINDAETATISGKRTNFEARLSSWNNDIYDAFDEIFWMPQTIAETQKHIIRGTWIAQNKV